MEHNKFFDIDFYPTDMLVEDILQDHQNELNWLFEEFEIQFLHTLDKNNEKQLAHLAKNFYRDYLLKFSGSSDQLKSEFGKFGLDLLYLQFHDLFH